LNVFENGEWRDKRSTAMLDCSKILFVLTTNAIDSSIIQFFTRNPQHLMPKTDIDLEDVMDLLKAALDPK
jgi:hypothetical protein